MTDSYRWIAALAAASLAVSSSVSADVLFAGSDLQQAVDAAQDGDTILVPATGAPGPFPMYAPVTIDGKGLSLVRQGEAEPWLDRLVVRNLPGTSRMNVSGLRIANSDFFQQEEEGVLLQNNAGAIRFQNCTIEGVIDTSGCCSPYGHGLVAEDCADLVLDRCSLRGGEQLNTVNGMPGKSGLILIDSTAAAYGCTIIGSDASPNNEPFPPFQFGADGADGVVLDGGLFYAAGCEIRAGDGGAISALEVQVETVSGDGGDGVRVVSGQAQILDSDLVAGSRGVVQFAGSPGEDGAAKSGNVLTLRGIARRLNAPLSVSDDAPSVEIQFEGAIGDHALLLVSTRTGFTTYPGIAGFGHMSITSYGTVLPLSVPLVAETMSFQIPTPAAARSSSLDIYMQGVFVDAKGNNSFGNPTYTLVLDQSL